VHVVHGGPGYAALYRMVLALEAVRVGLPQTIASGAAEQLLVEAAGLLPESGGGPVRRPYTGMAQEARLLAGLARALRARMEQAGGPVQGVDYFAERLDGFLARARAMLGLNPYLPLHGYDAAIGIS